MTQPLHPNLARLAVAYDEIVARHQQGRVSARQAHGEVAALYGRDDSGLVWTINPTTGRWCYRNLRGELVEGEPPRFGVPSPTPQQLGAGGEVDLDRRITYFEVDPTPFSLTPIQPPKAQFGALRRYIGKLRTRLSDRAH